VYAYSEVRSVVSQPKCHQIELFSWILDDGRAPATGIRRVNFEPTDGNMSPVSVRSALLKVAGYPGNFSRRAATRRAAGQECSMAYISTPPTCTAAVGCAHAGDAVGALTRRAPETKTDKGGVSESRIRLFHLRHDMYVLQIKCEHEAHRRSLSARAGMISTILR